MARKPRVEFEGAIYHITFRGNARETIFRDDRDRERLLQRLQIGVEEYGVRLYLYCLMTNHAHLLIETPRANLSRFMGSLLTAYTVYFNRRHRRVGHVTQGRFKAPLVEGDEYLLRLSRYVHLNPVYAREWEKRPLKERVAYLREYRWSSFHAYAGLAPQDEWMHCDPLWKLVSRGRCNPARAYARYVEAGLARTDEEFRELIAASPLGIGSAAFVRDVHKQYRQLTGKRIRREDVALRRKTADESVERVLAELRHVPGLSLDALRRQKRDVLHRAMAAHFLTRYAGLSQREVADLFRMQSGSSISHQIRWLRAQVERAPSLRRDMNLVEVRLSQRS